MDLVMREWRLLGTIGASLGSALRRHWRLAGGGGMLLVVAVAAVLLTGFHGGRAAAVVAPYPHELAQVSFAVAGDVIPHEPVRAPPLPLPETDQFAGLGRALQRCERRFSRRRLRLCEPGNAGGSGALARVKAVHVRRAGRAARRAEGQRHQDRFLRQQPRDGPGLGGICRDSRASARRGAVLCRLRRYGRAELAAGHRRGQRHQGGLAGHDALAQRQPQSREGRSAAREFLSLSG